MNINPIYVCHSKNHDFPIYIVNNEFDSQVLRAGLIKSCDGRGCEYGVINYETECEDKNLTFKEFVDKLINDSDGNLRMICMFRNNYNFLEIKLENKIKFMQEIRKKKK